MCSLQCVHFFFALTLDEFVGLTALIGLTATGGRAGIRGTCATGNLCGLRATGGRVALIGWTALVGRTALIGLTGAVADAAMAFSLWLCEQIHMSGISYHDRQSILR